MQTSLVEKSVARVAMPRLRLNHPCDYVLKATVC
jgi:hypothetical protein